MTWTGQFRDVIRSLHWTPRYLGLSSIAEDKYPSGFKVSKSLLAKGWRLCSRVRSADELLTYLDRQEEFLNYFLNIAFAIAPDEILSRLLCMPLGIADAGPFKSFGPGDWVAIWME